MSKRNRLFAVVVLVVMFVLCFASLAACQQPHEHTLKEYKKKEATCTADGVEAYWQCTDETCNKYFSDAKGENEISAPQTIAKLGHVDENKDFKCDRCGTGLCEHTKLSKVNAVEATCTTSGLSEYYVCDQCGQKFKDAEGKTKIATVATIARLSHEMENGICKHCNGRLFEAENATILPQSNNGDPVVQTVESASGGKIVGQFALENNKLTWIFTLSKAASNVAITMMLSPCEGVQYTLGTDIVINVNEQPVEWEDTVLTPISAPEAWHDYRPFATKNNITLAEGANKIEFVGVKAINVNIDCMIVGGIDKDAVVTDAHVHKMQHVQAVNATCTENGNVEYYICQDCNRMYADGEGNMELTDVTVVASHDFSESLYCKNCNALKTEAEDCTVVGTPTYGNESFYETPSAEIVAEKNASGRGWIGNWGNSDTMLYLRITSDKAVSGAKLRIRIACGWTGIPNLLAIYNKTTNSGYLDFDRSGLKGFDNNNYYNWGYLVTAGFDLVAGDNEIVVEAYDGQAVNLDYIVLENIGDAQVSITHACKDKCEKCGKCTTDCDDAHCADKCKCGVVVTAKTKLEVEDSVRISGNYEIANNSAASGGKLIGGWDQNYANSKFRIYFNASKAATNVQFEICASTFAFGGYLPGPDDTVGGDNAFYFVVNDAEGGIKFVQRYSLKSGTDWHVYDCFYVTLPVDIKEGINYVTIVGTSHIGINFDYINVIAPEDVTITLAHVCQHVCETCGKCKDTDCANAVCAAKCECAAAVVKQLKIEAENCQIEGTPTDADAGFTPAASQEWLDERDISGTNAVRNWGNSDNKIHVKLHADKAVNGATLRIRVACGWSATNPLFDVYSAADKATKYSLDRSEMKNFDGSNYYGWGFLIVQGINLAEGDNEIIIEGYQSQLANIDYFVLEYADGATVTAA